MNAAIWANLFWKEWCEHRWKLVSLIVVALSAFGVLLFSDRREVVTTSLWVSLLLYTPLGSLLIGMGLASSEQSRDTDRFLQATPCSLRQVALAKLIVGFGAVMIPAAILIAIACILHPIDSTWWSTDTRFHGVESAIGFGLAPWWVEFLTLQGLIAISFLLWMVNAGLYQRSELRAGALALMTVTGVWVVALLAAQIAWTTFADETIRPNAGTIRWGSILTAMAFLALPGALSVPLPISNEMLPVAAVVYSLAHGSLLWRWIVKYGHIVEKRQTVRREMPLSEDGWLGPPRTSKAVAIVWKQVRETAPIAGAVVGIVAGLATLTMLVEDGAPDLRGRVWVVAWLTAMSGFVAALLVGVAGFQDDLSPGLSGFWRSRPIDPGRWYWLKYAGGLAVLAAIFGGAYAACWLWDAEETRENSPYAAHAIAGFWLTYSVAVGTACWVRNAVYAGILSLFVAALIATVAYSEGLGLPTALQVTIVVAASVAATLIGWQATRRDWSLA